MTIDLEELRQKKAFEDLQANRTEEDGGRPVTTAFLVVQDKNGQWAALSDFADHDLVTDRLATLDDVIGGSAAINAGAQAQQTAMTTMMFMNQQAQAMQAQMANQRAASLIDPTKLRND